MAVENRRNFLNWIYSQKEIRKEEWPERCDIANVEEGRRGHVQETWTLTTSWRSQERLSHRTTRKGPCVPTP